MFSADEWQIQREEKADKDVNTTTVSQNDGANARPVDADRLNKLSRSRSRRRVVTDAGQADPAGKAKIDENTPAAELDRQRNEPALNVQPNVHSTDPTHLAPPIVLSSPPDENSDNAKAVPLPASPGERPSAGPGKAFPFKLGRHLGNEDVNASTITLASEAGVVSPKGDDDDESKQLGHNIIPSSPPDRTSEIATAVPLPASPGERPLAGPSKAYPFKLGRQPGDEGANASTVTLTNQAGVLSPKGDESANKQIEDNSDTQNEHYQNAWETSHRQTPTTIIEPVEDANGEQADGVDHYDLRNKLPLEGENGNELANKAVGPGEERRGTLEDAKGVLHHGPGVVGGLGEKKKDKEGEVRRLGVDRSDTASLD